MLPHAEDVAAAILERLGPLDTMSLQKLVYYSQAWHLAWRDKPLFPEKIEAWRDGPVVRRLFGLHQESFKVTTLARGDSRNIPEESLPIIEFVCGYYGAGGGGGPQGRHLRDRTHQEPPWAETRAAAGVKDGEKSKAVIPVDAIKTYYRSLPEPNDQAWFWTPEWQEGQKAAEEDERAGRVTRYTSDDEFLTSL